MTPEEAALALMMEERGGVGRQLGLGTRSVLQGLGDALAPVYDLAGGATNLGIHGLNAMGADLPFVNRAEYNMDSLLDATGLPQPASPGERVMGSALRTGSGVAPFLGAGLMSKGLAPLAASPISQVAGATAGGAAGAASGNPLVGMLVEGLSPQGLARNLQEGTKDSILSGRVGKGLELADYDEMLRGINGEITLDEAGDLANDIANPPKDMTALLDLWASQAKPAMDPELKAFIDQNAYGYAPRLEKEPGVGLADVMPEYLPETLSGLRDDLTANLGIHDARPNGWETKALYEDAMGRGNLRFLSNRISDLEGTPLATEMLPNLLRSLGDENISFTPPGDSPYYADVSPDIAQLLSRLGARYEDAAPNSAGAKEGFRGLDSGIPTEDVPEEQLEWGAVFDENQEMKAALAAEDIMPGQLMDYGGNQPSAQLLPQFLAQAAKEEPNLLDRLGKLVASLGTSKNSPDLSKAMFRDRGGRLEDAYPFEVLPPSADDMHAYAVDPAVWKSDEGATPAGMNYLGQDRRWTEGDPIDSERGPLPSAELLIRLLQGLGR